MQEFPATAPDAPSRRRCRVEPLSRRRSFYDGCVIFLLLFPAIVGPFPFGAVRLWSIGPLLLLAFTGLTLFALRPFFDADLRSIRAPPGGIAWLAFGLYAVAGWPFAAVPYEARIEWLKLASYIGAYWAWSDLATRHNRWKFLLGLLLLAVTLIAWYAIIQHAHESRLVLNLERPKQYAMRASGTYFCPNHFANLLEIVMPMALAILLMGEAGAPLRLLAGYSLALCLPVMFLTQSRSGWIATVVGLAATTLLVAFRRRRRLFWILLLGIPAGVAAMAVGLWFFSDIFHSRVAEALQGNIRIQIWRDTLRIIPDRWLTGWGGGAYQWVYPMYRTLREQMLFNYAHNEYLHLLVDYGAVGFALMGAVLVIAGVKLARPLLTSSRERDICLTAGLGGMLLGTLAHAMFDFNFHLFSNNHAMILVAGTVVGTLFASGGLATRPLTPGAWRLVWGTAVLLCAALFVATAFTLASYGYNLAAEQRRLKLQLEPAADYYRWAIRLDPGNWQPYLGLANVCQTRSFWTWDAEEKRHQGAAAIQYYEAMLRRNPYNAEALFGLSKVHRSLGRPEEAVAALEQAVQHDRLHLFYRTHLGIALREMGRDEEALRAFQETAAELGMSETVRLNIERLTERIAARAAATNSPPP